MDGWVGEDVLSRQSPHGWIVPGAPHSAFLWLHPFLLCDLGQLSLLETSVFPPADWGYHLPVSHQGPVKVKVEGRRETRPGSTRTSVRQSADGKIKSRPNHTGW